MKLDKMKTPDIFKSTCISDIFFSDYISELSPEAVKLYVYLLYLSKETNSITQTNLSKVIGMELKIFNESVRTLIEAGLIYQTEKGIEIPSLQGKVLLEMYNPKINVSKKKAEQMKKNSQILDVLDAINKQYLSGTLSSIWAMKIQNWYEKFDFEPALIMTIFSDCYSRGKIGMGYVSACFDELIRNKIFKMKDFEEYSQKRNKVMEMSNFISKKLRLMRNLTSYENEFVEKWVNVFNYDKEIIEIALKQTINKSSISLKYIDQILSNWNDNGLKEKESIENYCEIYRKNAIKNGLEKPGKDKETQIKVKGNNCANMNKSEKQFNYSEIFSLDDI